MSKAPQICQVSFLAMAATLALSMPATAGNGTALTLINGWKNYSDTTPKPTAYLIDGIVHLKGAIKTTGSAAQPAVGSEPSSCDSTVWSRSACGPGRA